MNYILSDSFQHSNFLPLSFTRSIADFRIGILTIKEKWEKLLEQEISIKTEDYLQPKYKYNLEDSNIIINSAVIPDKNLVNNIKNLKNEVLKKDNDIIAFTCDKKVSYPNKEIQYQNKILLLKNITDIFSLNEECIKSDFDLITNGRSSKTLNSTNTILGNNPIFIEDKTDIECCTFNTKQGPIYIGKNVTIMEGSHIRGPFVVCDNSIIKMGAKIYGSTTIGPWCKVGGEINNSVFFSHSNKAHDGYLGNSVIGEWCNMGAGSNVSNLKNSYVNVKLWNYQKERFVDTGLQFCGLIMADHSKCGINTMLNTGTVVGVSSNIYGGGFPRNFIPSFSQGGYGGMSELKLNNAFDIMNRVMQRRGIKLSKIEEDIFRHIFNSTSKYRNF